MKSTIEGIEVPILIDSGSSVSLMSSDFIMSIPALRSRPLKKGYIAARAVNRQMLDMLGTLTVTLELGTEIWQHVFHIVRETTRSVLNCKKKKSYETNTTVMLQYWGKKKNCFTSGF